jgi:hypothetical protein
VSEQLIVAAAAQIRDPGHFDGETARVPHVMLVREAVALLGRGTMTYQCDACGFEWKVWLAFGVEGPAELREHGLYVPAPFKAGRCPSWPVKPGATVEDRRTFQHLTRCEGQMGHVRWAQDEVFAPRLIPDDAPRFVLDHWYDSAHLHIPEPALIVARQFHHERADG